MYFYTFKHFLVSEDIDDELAGCIQFVEEFQNRYGDMRPEFFLGTLDQAIKIACFKPAKDVIIIFYYNFINNCLINKYYYKYSMYNWHIICM